MALNANHMPTRLCHALPLCSLPYLLWDSWPDDAADWDSFQSLCLKLHSAFRHAPLLAPLLLQLLLLPPPGGVCGRLGRRGRGRQRGREVARHCRDGVRLELRVRQHLACACHAGGVSGQCRPATNDTFTSTRQCTRLGRTPALCAYTWKRKGGAANTPSEVTI